MAKNVLETPSVGPEQIENLFEDAYIGLRKFFLLKYCLDYNVFGLLEKPKTFEEIASWYIKQDFKENDNLLESILDALVQFGLIKRYNRSYDSNIIYYETSEIAKIYLNQESEFSNMGSLIRYHKNTRFIEKWLNLDKTLKSGELKTKKGSSSPEAVKRMAIDCRTGELKSTIDYLKGFEDIKNAKSILDVAGGHGLYGIALSYLNEDSKCKVFDLPKICEETKKYIEEYGSERVSIIPGNYFKNNFVDTLDDSNPEGYDLIFTSNSPDCKTPEVLDKICEATALNGIFAAKQIFPENTSKKYATRKAFDNMDWNMFSFAGAKKGKVCHTLKNSLNLDGYITHLEEKGFEIVDIFSLEEKKSLKDINNYHNNIKKGHLIVIAKKIRN
ncbi:putative O-methyltransferase YrrM [Methanococcus voltae]|uniref:Putative O-methyltransferase YrrM n=1 Tax=Methanococcus voltae TaxID=2188 RepID=A0A8J7S627_METVO|nr:methyltransferase [Methanococcus voltae]MBP2202068.1 putative O-methyltransferase YrrM [Methanococcus voltae]